MNEGKREAEQRCRKNKTIDSLLSGFLSSVSKSLAIRLTESTSSQTIKKIGSIIFCEHIKTEYQLGFKKKNFQYFYQNKIQEADYLQILAHLNYKISEFNCIQVILREFQLNELNTYFEWSLITYDNQLIQESTNINIV